MQPETPNWWQCARISVASVNINCVCLCYYQKYVLPLLPLLLTRSVSPTSDNQRRLVNSSYPLSIMDASLIFPHLGLERGQVVISDTPIEDLISRCLEKARAINTLKKEVGMKCNLCMMQRLENGKKKTSS